MHMASSSGVLMCSLQQINALTSMGTRTCVRILPTSACIAMTSAHVSSLNHAHGIIEWGSHVCSLQQMTAPSSAITRTNVIRLLAVPIKMAHAPPVSNLNTPTSWMMSSCPFRDRIGTLTTNNEATLWTRRKRSNPLLWGTPNSYLFH